MDRRRESRFSVSPEKLVDTESNLSSAVFYEIVTGLGLEYRPIYETRVGFIDATLLHGRNKVEHGELITINADEALSRIDGVVLLLDEYADQLVDAASTERYLSPTTASNRNTPNSNDASRTRIVESGSQ